MAQAPKISELTQAAFVALNANSVFSAVAPKINKKDPRDPETGERSIVIKENGTKDSIIESRLRTVGFCVVVQPLIGGARRDQSGPAWMLNADLMVTVKCNPERNGDESGAQVDVYAAVREVIETLTHAERHPGGEFFQLAQNSFELSKFDEGIWAYNIYFRKEALL